MLNNCYHILSSSDFMTFEFESIGPKGIVTKVVRYREINVKGIYNLGFRDKDSQTWYVSDLTITNNKDSQRVLATVARTLYIFTENYPSAIVIASGSTDARTRLYQIGISNNLAAIEQDFDILGLIENNWEPFLKNVTYAAFSVRRKRVNL